MIAYSARSDALLVVVGVLLGVAVSASPVVTVGALVACGLTLFAVSRPTWLVVAVYGGILIDRIGLTGMEVSEFPITLSKLTVGGALGLWLVRGLLRGDRLVRWHPVLTSLVVVVAVTALSMTFVGTLKAGKFVVFGVLMTTILTGLVYAILAEAPLVPVYRLLSVGLVGTLLVSLAGAGGAAEAGRATGTMGDPNEWATVILLVTPFLLGGLADDRGWVGAALRVLLVLMAPMALLQAGSRSAMVAGALIAPACVYLLRSRGRELWVAIGVAAVAGPLLVDSELALARLLALVDNLRGAAVVEDSSLNERSELLRQGLDLFAEHWMFGVGPGRFAAATGFVSETGRLRPAHNTWLEVAGEQGVVGLAAVLGFVATVAWTMWRGVREANTVVDRNRVVGAAAGLAALALMATTLGLMTFSIAYLVLGCALAIVHQARAR
jgi:O-antigen ligase